MTLAGINNVTTNTASRRFIVIPPSISYLDSVSHDCPIEGHGDSSWRTRKVLFILANTKFRLEDLRSTGHALAAPSNAERESRAGCRTVAQRRVFPGTSRHVYHTHFRRDGGEADMNWALRWRMRFAPFRIVIPALVLVALLAGSGGGVRSCAPPAGGRGEPSAPHITVSQGDPSG